MGYEQPPDDNQPNEVLGVVLLMVAVLALAMATLGSAVILGIVYSALDPLASGLPSQALAVYNQVPAEAFYAYFVITGGVFVVAVIGILHIIFGWGRSTPVVVPG